MGVSRFGIVQADQFLGSQAEASPFGKIFYVDGTHGADGNSGLTPEEPKATIKGAIDATIVTRGDTIVVYPGTYTITAALVPLANTTIKAAHVVPRYPTVSIQGNIDELVTVDASGCRFIGLDFRATGTTCTKLVDVADGASVNGLLFEDCTFTQSRGGAQALNFYDATYIASGVVVRRCLFAVEAASVLGIGILGIPYSIIEDNTFVLETTTSTGIHIADTAVGASGSTEAVAATGRYVIRNNDFIGLVSGTHVGITIKGTENFEPPYIIRTNYFAHCAAAAITANVATVNRVANYVGDTGTGGTLVDAGN